MAGPSGEAPREAVSLSSASGTPWHADEVSSVFERVESSPAGLSSAQAVARLSQYGPNELTGGRSVSAWGILLQQFRNVLIIILLVATAISIALGEGVESVVIAVIVVFAVLLGFVQEYRAERALEALREMAAPTALVVRDGEEVQVPTRELVPGDVVVLHPGDRVPADGRVVESVNLMVDEAPLTGESTAVEKQS
ncbi:MAG TPA: HAD-IC family P-type ATPase, partial [Propionibacteriaceae bacterium]|nr:HAD-IC family P-type ATPase [Propionibacteriaceae bacterium]